MSNVEIRRHTPGRDTKDFVRAGEELFKSDPAWIAPLRFEIGQRLHPKHNPFFDHADVALFTAWKDGRLVGRCSASIDREHLRIWKDDTGFFGFFDTIDDVDVARSLLEEAERFCKSRGMKNIRGPMSLYANEEIGLLIDGFEHPPVMMMGHSLPHQRALAEACGYEKELDLFCWKYDSTLPLPERTIKAWENVKALPEVKLRSLDKKNMKRELDAIMDIYNDAWGDKWAFVPATPAEADKMVKELSMILDPDLAFMAEVNGKPAGMCIMVPNLNEAIADLRGRLSPVALAKLLWRLKVKHPKSTRLIMLGIKKDVRANVKRYGGLSAAMYVECCKRGVAKGYEWAELSWTRENDAPINVGIRAMGAKRYKTYRVFKKPLTSP
jgi:hypothetical protein